MKKETYDIITMRENLIYEREHNLNTKPLLIDFLVIEKNDGVHINNEMWRM